MTKDQKQLLFNYFSENHEVLLLDGDFNEIDYILESKGRKPFTGFWQRLKTFIEAVRVNDPLSQEEKDMILSVCESPKSEQKPIPVSDEIGFLIYQGGMNAISDFYTLDFKYEIQDEYIRQILKLMFEKFKLNHPELFGEKGEVK